MHLLVNKEYIIYMSFAKTRLQFSQQIYTTFTSEQRKGTQLGMTEIQAYQYAGQSIATKWASSREELQNVHATNINRLQRKIDELEAKNARQVEMIERLQQK